MLCCLFSPVGFVGYLPSDKSIYVVFRGSSSIRNWITNLDAYKTPYTSYPACKCEVHKGFYSAEQIVIGGIISEVKRLKSISSLSTYSVKTTGHSLGAALAQLTAMGESLFSIFRKYNLDNVECIFSPLDLLKAGYSVSMYNFGQPRVGDQAYAVFSTSTLSSYRVTHDKDIVPHIPLSTGMDFYHACFEEFEDV
jgi:predicted lipase